MVNVKSKMVSKQKYPHHIYSTAKDFGLAMALYRFVNSGE